MQRYRTIPLVVLALALLACTIQSQAAAWPALATITPTPQAAVITTNTPNPTTTPTQPPQPTAAAQECKVSTGTPGGFLNLRAGPGTSFDVRAVLTEGQTLMIIKSAGGWIQVQTESGAVGWVYTQYCEVQR